MWDKVWKILGVTFLVTILLGCINSNGLVSKYLLSTPSNEQTEKIIVGIPLVLSISGSSARLNDQWMVTAAHNKNILSILDYEAYYHPTCDIALYKKEGKSENVKGNYYVGTELWHVGYPLGLGKVSSSGEFLGIVYVPTDECVYGSSTSDTVGGMSGGGVYTRGGSLVGVTIGYLTETLTYSNGKVYDSPTVFAQISQYQDWIDSIIQNN
ncbi:TMhelix containing protein [Vibrio phage 1.121.O._10N.286.46.C4]|nr:TMhelix containing protein [Vibrio phage 1.121.O._10N.286.46.C4]